MYGTSEAEALANVGADGWIVVLDPDGERELLDELYPVAAELGACAVEVGRRAADRCARSRSTRRSS